MRAPNYIRKQNRARIAAKQRKSWTRVVAPKVPAALRPEDYLHKPDKCVLKESFLRQCPTLRIHANAVTGRVHFDATETSGDDAVSGQLVGKFTTVSVPILFLELLA